MVQEAQKIIIPDNVRTFSLSAQDAERIKGSMRRQYREVNFEGDGDEPLYEYTLKDGTVLQEYFDHGLHLSLRQLGDS